jgi:hypothetical protein
LIRDPNRPVSPFSPNRLGIILLGLLLGGIVATSLAIVRESADPSVRGTADMAAYANLPLLGAVPTLLNQDDRRRTRMVWMGVAGAYSLGAIIVAITYFNAGG